MFLRVFLLSFSGAQQEKKINMRPQLLNVSLGVPHICVVSVYFPIIFLWLICLEGGGGNLMLVEYLVCSWFTLSPFLVVLHTVDELFCKNVCCTVLLQDVFRLYC